MTEEHFDKISQCLNKLNDSIELLIDDLDLSESTIKELKDDVYNEILDVESEIEQMVVEE